MLQYIYEKYGRDRRKQHWLKAHAMVGNETNIITAIVVTDGTHNDSPEMPGLIDRTVPETEDSCPERSDTNPA